MSKRTIVDVLIAAAILAVALLLFPRPASGQVADKPITSWPDQWTGVVYHVTGMAACVAGWAPPADKYGEPKLQIAFVDFAKMTAQRQQQMVDAINAGKTAELASMRNATFIVAPGQVNAMAKPCYDKLQPPPARWVVADDADGKRPAYLLNADGTRGKQVGSIDLMVTGNGKTVRNRCDCRVRALSTTSSTWCRPYWYALPSTEAAPMPDKIVTLCQAPKS